MNRNNTNSNYVGDSWANAIPDLQFAINFAGDDDNRPDIWIAEGIYYGNGWPYVDAFIAMNGVNLYGGFAGNETSLDQRVYGAHPTILDGQNIQRTLQQAKEDYFKYRKLEDLQYAVYDGLTIRNGFYQTDEGGFAGLTSFDGVRLVAPSYQGIEDVRRYGDAVYVALYIGSATDVYRLS